MKELVVISLNHLLPRYQLQQTIYLAPALAISFAKETQLCTESLFPLHKRVGQPVSQMLSHKNCEIQNNSIRLDHNWSINRDTAFLFNRLPVKVLRYWSWLISYLPITQLLCIIVLCLLLRSCCYVRMDVVGLLLLSDDIKHTLRIYSVNGSHGSCFFFQINY